MSLKPGSKYFPLYQYLQGKNQDRVQLSFAQVEQILSVPLPRSARNARGFWSNRSRGGHQAAAWLEAGYRVESIDLASGKVEFKKEKVSYSVPRQDDSLAWDAEALRALRRHLGLSQADFAETIGVRQQTVSEWETGQYEPTRSRSKHLQIVAERADFPYSVEDEA